MTVVIVRLQRGTTLRSTKQDMTWGWLKAKATAADLASVLPLQECMEAQSASAGREGQEEGAAMPASCRHGDFSDSASTKFKLVCSNL
jgi:hypothetical protein